jgi:hypothetical protein
VLSIISFKNLFAVFSPLVHIIPFVYVVRSAIVFSYVREFEVTVYMFGESCYLPMFCCSLCLLCSIESGVRR